MERYCIKCGKITHKKNESCYVCAASHENWVNPAIGSAVFIIKNNKVLYGVRAQDPNEGKLDLPGGFIEVNETAEHAAIREAKEEVGIDIKLLGIIGTYTGNYQGRPSLDIVFVAHMLTDTIIAGDDLKGGDPIWRDFSNLPRANEVADVWFSQAQNDLLVWLHQNPRL